MVCRQLGLATNGRLASFPAAVSSCACENTACMGVETGKACETKLGVETGNELEATVGHVSGNETSPKG